MKKMNREKSDKVNILYITDNNFACQSWIALKSLFSSNDGEKIVVHFIDAGVAEDNLKKIQDLCKNNKAELSVYDSGHLIKQLLTMSLNVPNDQNSLSTLIRLYIFQVLPDTIKRILYVDTDTVISRNIEDLYYSNFEESIAAAKDATYDFFIKSLGEYNIKNYFNAGVILINLEKFNKKMKEANLAILIKKQFRFADQDILNIIFNNDVHIIKPKFNATSRYRIANEKELMIWTGFKKDELYDKNDLKEAAEMPTIVHYTSSFLGRPWDLNSQDPENNLWRKYYFESPWRNVSLKSRKLSVLNKFARLLYAIIPNKIYFRIDYVHTKRKNGIT